jgi:hypothetical protein
VPPARQVVQVPIDRGLWQTVTASRIFAHDLVDLAEPADRFTVIGAGKTAIDTCVWLLEAGVDPDHIRWSRGRDPWQFDRNFTQPLNLVGSSRDIPAHPRNEE